MVLIMRVALYQSEIKWEDKVYNINKSKQAIIEAASKRANIILMPG